MIVSLSVTYVGDKGDMWEAECVTTAIVCAWHTGKSNNTENPLHTYWY